MADTSFALVMLGIAAAVALLIGVVGIYGVIAYAVAQRTREIGLRIALGAQIADVRTLFLRQGLWLTAIGILIGMGVAIAAARVVSSFLFGVGPADPVTYAVVSVMLAAIALGATYLPARLAARVDPIVATRAGQVVGASDGHLRIAGQNTDVDWGGTTRLLDSRLGREVDVAIGTEALGSSSHPVATNVGTALAFRDVTLGPGEAFLLSDYRSHVGQDSRTFGPVKLDRCTARVFMRFAPTDASRASLGHAYLDLL